MGSPICSQNPIKQGLFVLHAVKLTYKRMHDTEVVMSCQKPSLGDQPLATPALSAETIQKIRELIAEGKPHSKISKELGVSKAAISKYRNHEGPAASPVANESIPERTDELTGDNWNISIKKTNISTVDELLAECKVDLGIWEVDRFQVKHWGMGFVAKAVTTRSEDETVTVRESGAQPLFSISAILKKKKHVVDARAEIEALKAEAKQAMFIPKPVIYTTQDSDNMFEALIPDLHAAKLAWGRETGYKNYDTGEAVDCYRRAIDELLHRASSFNLGKIVLGVGNDLLQADNIQGTTYAGTKVDVDSRYRKTYVTVRKMLAETVEKLRKIAPVDVKVVPGNHDTLSSFTLGDSLECKFEHYPDVTVDNGPMMHKTVEWGDCFLVLMHGDKGKQSDYGTWLATTYRKEFGRTRFNEIHVGHKHKLAVDEKYGIRVRTFSSLSGTDEWHASNLFTGNLRVADGLIWNKTKGLIAQFHHTETDEVKAA